MNNSLAFPTLIVSGLFALLGTIAGGVVKGYWDVQLAEQKFHSDLVLKALESTSAQERLETLKLLVDTNLIKESSIRNGVENYIRAKQQDPSTIPQIKPPNPVLPDTHLRAHIQTRSGKVNDIAKRTLQVLSSAGYLTDYGRVVDLTMKTTNLILTNPENVGAADQILPILQPIDLGQFTKDTDSGLKRDEVHIFLNGQ